MVSPFFFAAAQSVCEGVALTVVRHGQQTLILSTSSRGDPLNINCPESYVEGVTNLPRLPSSRGRFGG